MIAWLVVSLAIQHEDFATGVSGAVAGGFGWFAAALLIGAFK